MNKKGLKKFYLIFSIILSITFFIIDQNHDCSGDGCLICLFSSIVHFVTNVLLLMTFVPIIIEKLSILFNIAYSNISKKEYSKEEKPVFINPINNIVTNLVTFGVKIQ